MIRRFKDEEERRLFYVAMTRARDTLQIYAREGTGKVNKTPAGYMRDLIEDESFPLAVGHPGRVRRRRWNLCVSRCVAYFFHQSRKQHVWFELPVLEGSAQPSERFCGRNLPALRIAVQTRAGLALRGQAGRGDAIRRCYSSRAQDIFRFDEAETAQDRR